MIGLFIAAVVLFGLAVFLWLAGLEWRLNRLARDVEALTARFDGLLPGIATGIADNRRRVALLELESVTGRSGSRVRSPVRPAPVPREEKHVATS